MPRSEEYDWIFDYTLQFLESDKFDASIMDFVDEKCLVFEDDEENKLIYTDIHREFVEHVEALIATYLADVGVTTETFLESCERARSGRDINTTVFERMTAMEDFQTFKKLMIKRNLELQLESIRSFKAASFASPPARTHRLDAKSESKEVRSEGKDAEDEAAWLAALTEMDLDQLSDEEVQELLLQSLVEMEILHTQEALEAAELEAALRMSLVLDEEVEVPKEHAAAREVTSTAVSKPNSTVAEAKAAAAEPREEKLAARPERIRQEEKQEKGQADEPLLKPLKPLRGTGNPLPPLRSALPALGSSEMRDRAERALQEQQAARKGQEALQESLASSLGASQMETRARHMQEQREKLLALKRQERQEKVQREESKAERKEEPRTPSSPSKEVRADAGSVTSEEVAEVRRQQLRLALARRMKADTRDEAEQAQVQTQNSQILGLDRRLQEVEALRDEHRRRDEAVQRALERQRDTLARNVELSAQRLRDER